MRLLAIVCCLVFSASALGQEKEKNTIHPVDIKITKDRITFSCVKELTFTYDPGKGVVETKGKTLSIPRGKIKTIQAVGILEGDVFDMYTPFDGETLRIYFNPNSVSIRFDLP